MMKKLDPPSKLHIISQEKNYQKKILKGSHLSHHCQAKAEVQNNYFNKVHKGI